jgi:hypothetical protein
MGGSTMLWRIRTTASARTKMPATLERVAPAQALQRATAQVAWRSAECDCTGSNTRHYWMRLALKGDNLLLAKTAMCNKTLEWG